MEHREIITSAEVIARLEYLQSLGNRTGKEDAEALNLYLVCAIGSRSPDWGSGGVILTHHKYFAEQKTSAPFGWVHIDGAPYFFPLTTTKEV